MKKAFFAAAMTLASANAFATNQALASKILDKSTVTNSWTEDWNNDLIEKRTRAMLKAKETYRNNFTSESNFSQVNEALTRLEQCHANGNIDMMRTYLEHCLKDYNLRQCFLSELGYSFDFNN